MNILYIEARKKFKDIDMSPLDNLEGNTISLAATIQYIDLVPKVKQYLESKNKKVIIKNNPQVLGCNSSAFDNKADTLLLITDGKFHAINNAIALQREIHVFNTRTLEKVEQKEIDTHNQKVLTKQKKFLTAKKVGLLVSTKQGQNFGPIQKIKKQIEALDKRAYIFEANNINPAEFENFPQIQIWINTACYGLARDSVDIINLQDVSDFIKTNS